MQRTAAILFAISLTHLVGCASILLGPTEEITITSEPSGAELSLLPTGQTVITPASLHLKKKTDYTVRARLECHDVETAYIESGPHFLIATNLLFGLWSPIGFLIDLTNSRGYDLEPEEIHFLLRKLPDCPPEEPPPDTAAQDDALQPTQRRPEEGKGTAQDPPDGSPPDEPPGKDAEPTDGETESKQEAEPQDPGVSAPNEIRGEDVQPADGATVPEQSVEPEPSLQVEGEKPQDPDRGAY